MRMHFPGLSFGSELNLKHCQNRAFEMPWKSVSFLSYAAIQYFGICRRFWAHQDCTNCK